MKRRPRAIQLYALLGVVVPVVAVVRGGGDAVLVVPAVALLSLLTYGVWMGNRVAWGLAGVLQIVALLPIGDYGPLWTTALNVVALICLVLPSARAFVIGMRPGSPSTSL